MKIVNRTLTLTTLITLAALVSACETGGFV